MSRTTVYQMPECGQLVQIATFSNSSGAAPRIWGVLWESLYGGTDGAFQTIHKGGLGRMFHRVKDGDLGETESILLLWTADFAVVETHRLLDMAKAMRDFDACYPTLPGNANHLLALADLYECQARSIPTSYLGLCVQQTSVADSWCVSTEDDEPAVLYDASIHDGHWFVFERLDSYRRTGIEPCK